MADAAPGAPAVPALPLPQRVAQFEATVLRETLASVGGNFGAALALLGIPRKTLYDKLARYGINPADYRES